MASTWIARKWKQAPQKVKVEFPTRVDQMIFSTLGIYPSSCMIVIVFLNFWPPTIISSYYHHSPHHKKIQEMEAAPPFRMFLCWLVPAPHNQEFSCCSWFFSFIATTLHSTSILVGWVELLCICIFYHIHFHFLSHVMLKLSILINFLISYKYFHSSA